MVRLKVKEVAEQKKISMGALSRLSNISYRTVKLIYKDPYRDINVSTLVKIARTLKVKLDDLVEEVPDISESSQKSIDKADN